MTPRLSFSPEAEREIAGATEWYAARSAAVGADFLREVEDTLHRISEFPQQFPLVQPELQRAGLRRFPYALTFNVRAERTHIVECRHQRRDPLHARLREVGQAYQMSRREFDTEGKRMRVSSLSEHPLEVAL
jgi:plasmid stabilization system protein ParE